MENTAVPCSGATFRTADGEYLFGREFDHFHFDNIWLYQLASLYKIGHCLGLVAEFELNFRDVHCGNDRFVRYIHHADFILRLSSHFLQFEGRIFKSDDNV